MKQQTAVEWLFKWMIDNKDLIIEERLQAFEQAKEMEKEQIVTAWNTAHEVGRFEGKGIAEKDCQTFETYWKANFKS
jgi:hypothetical protein